VLKINILAVSWYDEHVYKTKKPNSISFLWECLTGEQYNHLIIDTYSLTGRKQIFASYHPLCSNIQEISWSKLFQISHDSQIRSSLCQAMVFWTPDTLLQAPESLYHSHPAVQGVPQRREMSEKRTSWVSARPQNVIQDKRWSERQFISLRPGGPAYKYNMRSTGYIKFQTKNMETGTSKVNVINTTS
jgi:hypothetical protein